MLHLIWDMDGTLVDSEPEILSTIKKSLDLVGVSIDKVLVKLRIGPPVKDVIRNAFSQTVLSDEQLEEVVKNFRLIYDTSNYEVTKPFEGIDDLIHDSHFVHHVITNKPFYATNRILKSKGWDGCVVEIITPDSLLEVYGKRMTKPEMFRYCRAAYPDAPMVGIGDMALDAESAIEAKITAIGVLWGTGTRNELKNAGCRYIVETSNQLKDLLYNLSNE